MNKILKLSKTHFNTNNSHEDDNTNQENTLQQQHQKMKPITIMSLLPKNLQFQHIIHHKQEHQHQYTLNPLEFPLEL